MGSRTGRDSVLPQILGDRTGLPVDCFSKGWFSFQVLEEDTPGV